MSNLITCSKRSPFAELAKPHIFLYEGKWLVFKTSTVGTMLNRQALWYAEKLNRMRKLALSTGG